jgi:hypothetical protein
MVAIKTPAQNVTICVPLMQGGQGEPGKQDSH